MTVITPIMITIIICAPLLDAACFETISLHQGRCNGFSVWMRSVKVQQLAQAQGTEGIHLAASSR